MSLFQCLVSLYSNRGLPPPSVCQLEEEGRGSPGSGIVFLHCDCFLVPRQQQGREQRLMDSSEPWELDLLDCEDVIYSCNLFGDCGRHQWSSLSGRWAVLGQSPFSVRCLPGLWCGLRGFEPVTYVSCLAPELRVCAAPALTKNLFCPCLATTCPVPGSLFPQGHGL